MARFALSTTSSQFTPTLRPVNVCIPHNTTQGHSTGVTTAAVVAPPRYACTTTPSDTQTRPRAHSRYPVAPVRPSAPSWARRKVSRKGVGEAVANALPSAVYVVGVSSPSNPRRPHQPAAAPPQYGTTSPVASVRAAGGRPFCAQPIVASAGHVQGYRESSES